MEQPVTLDIDRVFSITIKLINVLNKETEILATMKIDDFSKINEDKLKLAQELEGQYVLIEENPSVLKGISKARANKLKEIAIAFEEAKEKNVVQLKNAILVNKEFIELIRNTLMESIQNQVGYNDNGNYLQGAKLEKEMPPLTFNSNI